MITNEEARRIVSKARKIVKSQNLNGVAFWGYGIWDELLRISNCIGDNDSTSTSFGQIGSVDANLECDAICLVINGEKKYYCSYQELLDH